MRRTLLLLMIALLPLRAWAGDVMALTVSLSATAAVVQTGVPPCHGDSASHTPSPSVDTTNVAHHTAQTDSHSDNTQASCTSCDICHVSALGGPAVCSSPPSPLVGFSAPTSARFASAVLPGQHKPPIA